MNETPTLFLEEAVLERLAEIICGDDDSLLYRSGFELVKFFRAAGWTVADLDGEGRRRWTAAQIVARKDDGPALAQLVLKLADPRQYFGEERAHGRVVEELNGLLAFEGLVVVDTDTRPRLTDRADSVERVNRDEPAILEVSVAEVVTDPELAEQLTLRLEEARRCLDSGAPTATVIMLGSVLEGVLYDVALHRFTSEKQPSDHLESLINLAHRRRWITKDVVDYAHVVRGHRNLVHPKRQ
ncbi:hypothetical protein [Pseudonocardia pini]|uniref:hypothetical protein n=1 Tax=Pseudonocardia pini TaxID=2758030 RepID=UPI0015F02F48|nr:hypothetical protein [Pseudonocardia pini]